MPPEADSRDVLLAFLDFHVANGFDVPLDDLPHDRFAEDAAPAPASRLPDRPAVAAEPARPARALPLAATLPPDAVAADARARAATAGSLAELEAIVAAFEGCALRATARQLAFADGRAGSRVMIVGEAPGADEDRVGKPFVGRAGQLLDRMLGAIGLGRQDVYIANVVPWRPPGNRTPTPQEVAICLPFIARQIALARPEVLVTVGAAATQTLTGTKDGITRARGRWLAYAAGEEPGLRVLPMLHPAYLLRSPVHKRLAWRDLRLLRRALDLAEPRRAEPGPTEPGERGPT